MSKRDEKEMAAFEEALAENPYDEATHKVFADWLEEHGFDDEALLQREWTPEKMHAAEEFMREFAAACGISEEELREGAELFLDTGEEICLGAEGVAMAYGNYPEFWQYFMVLTCRPVPDDRREVEFISCAC